MPTDLPRAAAFLFGVWLALESVGGFAAAALDARQHRASPSAVSAPAAPR